MFSTNSADRMTATALLAAGVLLSCSIATSALAAGSATAGTITALAGTGTAGYTGDGAAATTARLSNPQGTAIDGAGNVYIADANNHRVRKVAAGTGIITTVAGTGANGFFGDGGAATSARLSSPSGVAVDAAGNLYIADYGNGVIRKVVAATGVISTVAGNVTYGFSGDGGQATAAALNRPTAVAVDAAGNLYIADRYNHRIRKVTAGNQVITTVAGNGTASFTGDGGPATSASMEYPFGVAVDAAGNLYIADTNNHRIRKVAAGTGIITTVAGTGQAGFLNEGGTATSARLYFPCGIAVDASGNLFIADQNNHRVRKLTAATGILNTVAGSGTAGLSGDGGLATAAWLYYPVAVAVDASGNLYIADTSNDTVRKVSTPSPTLLLTTIAGNGTSTFSGDGGAATAASLSNPYGVAADAAGNVYIADSSNHRIRKVSAATGVMTTVVGTGQAGFLGDGGPATSARLYFPCGIALDGAGNLLIADQNNHRIRKVSATTGIITTVAGNGNAGFGGDGSPATGASLYYPCDVAVDAPGNLYIADTSNHRIRLVRAGDGVITTLVGTGASGGNGDGGAATLAQLSNPAGVTVDGAGNVYIADTSNSRIRKRSAATGIITTIAGTGASGYAGENEAALSARLYLPRDIMVDTGGNLYFTETNFDRIRKVSAAGLISTVAGCGNQGAGGDGGAATAGQLYNPNGIFVDAAGTLYIGDTTNHRVRKASVPLVAPTGLRANPSGRAAVQLDWVAAPGATSYTVKRGTASGSLTVLASGIAAIGYIDRSPAVGVRYYYAVSAVYGSGESDNSNEVFITLPRSSAPADFDGDGKADITVYRPSNGHWFVRQSSSGFDVGSHLDFQWGFVGDVPLRADFDGDGREDLVVYRPSTGDWFIRYSSTGYSDVNVGQYQWGLAGDTPLAGDFDGDGKTDLVVYRPTTGEWFVRYSSHGYAIGTFALYQWGLVGDKPLAADFDGDGKTDLCVYRPTTGEWFVRSSASGYSVAGFAYYQWGLAGDLPLVADFDGDTKTDLTVYRPSTGEWFIRYSSQAYSIPGFALYQWGLVGDTPIAGDFDADGKTELSVYRPATGDWYICYSSRGYNWPIDRYQWGLPGDTPLLGGPR